MTGVVIKPVAIPATPPRHDRHAGRTPSGSPAVRRTLPLPTIPTLRTSGTVYGLAAVDCRARMADHTVLTALGWMPGTRLHIRESRGLLVIRPDAHGVFA